MIMGVLGVIVLAILVTGYFAISYYQKQKAEGIRNIERLEGAHIFKMRILRNLLHMKNKTNYKARLMEELSMEIEMLKVCVEQLKNEKLITEGPHNLTLTDFGKQFAQIYAKQDIGDGEKK